MSPPTLPSSISKPAKLAASLAILTILSSQAFTAIFHRACSRRPIPLICQLPAEPGMYPFLDYPMYKSAHYENAVVEQYALIGTFRNGTTQQLDAEDFTLSPYRFHRNVIPAFIDNDQLQMQQYIDAYNQTGAQPLATLQLESHPLVVTKNGIVNGEQAVINRLVVTAEYTAGQ